MSDAPETPKPKKLADLPDYTVEWLTGITKRDIERFEKWQGFIAWAEQTGKMGKAFIIAAMAIFGGAVAIAQGWDTIKNMFRGPP